MKLVWVGIVLLVATIGMAIGCGPKEKYCYQEQEPCSLVKGQIEQDAMYEAPPDADAPTGNCFDNQGNPIACADN